MFRFTKAKTAADTDGSELKELGVYILGKKKKKKKG